MYEALFGLREAPFTTDPDERLIVCRPAQRELVARLRGLLIDDCQNVALTGVAGSGKSTLARLLLRALPDDTEPYLFQRPPADVRELLESLTGTAGRSLGIRELVQRLRERLLDQHRAGRRPLLVIDEAHLLRPELLRQLARLLDARIRGMRALPALLLGRPAPAGNLARGDGSYLDLADACVDCPAMNFTAAREYVEYKLRAAGGDPELIALPALRALHKRSQGLPRHLDIACDKALASAYLNDNDRVELRDVRRAFAEASPTRRLTLPRWATLALPLAIALLGTGALLYWWSSLGAGVRDVAAVIGTPAPEAPAAPGIVLPPRAGDEAVPARLVDFALSQRTSKTTAGRRLLAQWMDGQAHEPGEPLCEAVRRLDFRCLQGWGDWADLARLDRPAILTLWDGPQRSFHAVVAGLDETSVHLDIDGRMHSFALAEVQAHWHGEYLVLWKPPLPGVEYINAGSSAEAVAWLRSALDRVDGGAAGESAAGDVEFDWPLVKRVMAFQARAGLEPDGTVGPSTFMALARELGDDAVPRLRQETLALN